MPRPPCCAMAIAMCDSVTVSMAALMMGMFSRMLRESWVCVLVLAGTTSERAGRSNTSSNVRGSGTGKWIIGFWIKFLLLGAVKHPGHGQLGCCGDLKCRSLWLSSIAAKRCLEVAGGTHNARLCRYRRDISYGFQSDGVSIRRQGLHHVANAYRVLIFFQEH